MEHVTLYLVAAVLHGMWMHCAYATAPATARNPEPPIYVIKALPPHRECEAWIIETVRPAMPVNLENVA